MGEIECTPRGFQRIEFLDDNFQSCSLQQSSLAEYEPPGSSAIWLGVGDKRMHLQYKTVKLLVPILQAWIDTGRFEVQDVLPDTLGGVG